MNYLVIFTIGPVQAFIVQARKTRDLYAGSRILSKIIQKSLPKEGVIFPHPQIESMPNRFIAEIKTENIQDFCDQTREKIQQAYQAILEESRKEGKAGVKEGYQRQSENFLEIHYAALPLDKSYEKVYPELERLLGAAKNGRIFSQMEEWGKKCSLCGERNVLFYRDSKISNKKYHYGSRQLKGELLSAFETYHENLIPLKQDGVTLAEREGLCAICFTKRFYPVSKFPSTAEIALMDTLQKLESEPEKKKLESLLSGKWDEQLYFEENLTQEYFQKYNLPVEKLNDLKKALDKLQKKAKEKG
ncbi:MAG: hypothetical protein D6785_03990, partial [Planctomycetota bacterium]